MALGSRVAVLLLVVDGMMLGVLLGIAVSLGGIGVAVLVELGVRVNVAVSDSVLSSVAVISIANVDVGLA